MTAPRSERIRTFVVDDEPLARDGIRLMLAGDPEVEIVGEAGSGAAAAAGIAAARPDVLLLDVHVPDVDGFGVLRELRALLERSGASAGGARAPAVVFVTAYDAYALKAFEVRAVDYVLKPFGERRLREAVHRAKEHVRLSHAAELLQSLGGPPNAPGAKSRYAERLEVRSGGRVTLVPVAEIDWIEAYDDYARLHVGGRRLLVAERMQELERSLDPARFARIHRSALVNVARVRELYHRSHGDYVVVLADGTRLRMSRSRRRGLLSRARGT